MDDPGRKDCGSGWESYEMRVRLDAWARARRIPFVRRPAEKKIAVVDEKPRKVKAPEKSKALAPTKPTVVERAEFDFVKDLTGREWDCCALVTNDETHDATALSQLYRDRGDCENNFDGGKNQWGRAGFTTKKVKSCRAMARLIAIVANRRNVFCRMADPSAHREAVTSRPAFLYWLNSTAPQLNPDRRWKVVVHYVFRLLLIPDPSLRALVPIRQDQNDPKTDSDRLHPTKPDGSTLSTSRRLKTNPVNRVNPVKNSASPRLRVRFNCRI